jgi:hypothetical protein
LGHYLEYVYLTEIPCASSTLCPGTEPMGVNKETGMGDDGSRVGQPSAGAQAALLACGLFSTIGLFSPGLVLPQIERAFAAVPHAALTH